MLSEVAAIARTAFAPPATLRLVAPPLIRFRLAPIYVFKTDLLLHGNGSGRSDEPRQNWRINRSPLDWKSTPRPRSKLVPVHLGSVHEMYGVKDNTDDNDGDDNSGRGRPSAIGSIILPGEAVFAVRILFERPWVGHKL